MVFGDNVKIFPTKGITIIGNRNNSMVIGGGGIKRVKNLFDIFRNRIWMLWKT